MKVELPSFPQTPLTTPTERRGSQAGSPASPTAENGKAPATLMGPDKVEISSEAAAARAAEEETRFTGTTRERVVQANHEALWDHALDAKEVVDLLQYRLETTRKNGAP